LYASLLGVLLFGTTLSLYAAQANRIEANTAWGRTELKAAEIEGALHIELESVAQLISGRPRLEPALKLEGRRLLAMPLGKAKTESLPKGAERPLMLNPEFAAQRRAVVISPRVTDWGGKKWVPLADLVKATGAEMSSCAFPDVWMITVPDNCDASLLVAPRE
jgi:hypothetical protein